MSLHTTTRESTHRNVKIPSATTKTWSSEVNKLKIKWKTWPQTVYKEKKEIWHLNAVSSPGLDSELGRGEWGCCEGQFEEADSLNMYHVWSDVSWNWKSNYSYIRECLLLLGENKLRYSSVKEYGVCNLFANGLAKQEFMSMWASTYVYSKILAMGESGWRVRGWSSNLSGRIPIDVFYFFFLMK